MYRFVRAEIEEILDRYIDRVLTESTPDRPVWNVEKIKDGKAPAWNYIDGCMLTGLLNLYFTTKEQKYLDFVKNFVDFYVGDDGSIRGYRVEEYNIDNISAGRVLFDLYKIFGEEKYSKAIELIYSQLLTHPRNSHGSLWHKQIYPNQVWLDGLYMAQVFYTRYQTQRDGCARYEDILHQYRNVNKYMFDADKKLYRHGWDPSLQAFWADKQTGLSAGYWLRSMGWFIASIVDVIEYLDPSAEHMRAELEAIFRQAIEGVLQYIDLDSKMFFQVVDCVNREGNYPETSGSALIAYALVKSVRLGIVTTGYLHTARGIFNGIAERYLSEQDGKLHLGGICLVAGLGPENNRRRDGSYEYYVSEPIVSDDAKGLGPYLMLYSEMKRVN